MAEFCSKLMPQIVCIQVSAWLLSRRVHGVTDIPILLQGSGPSATCAGPASNCRGIIVLKRGLSWGHRGHSECLCGCGGGGLLWSVRPQTSSVIHV